MTRSEAGREGGAEALRRLRADEQGSWAGPPWRFSRPPEWRAALALSSRAFFGNWTWPSISNAPRDSLLRLREGGFMQLGMIGLGRMGANMIRRVMRAGHGGVVFDRSAESVASLAGEGAAGSASLEEFVGKLEKPRAAWIMVPAGAPTEATVVELLQRMEPGDTVIDGGNSYFKDDVRRAGLAKEKGIHYLDVVPSGGVWGLERGYCLMIGGEKAAVERRDPIFRALAPGRGNVARTP